MVMARRRNRRAFYAARDARIWEIAAAPKYLNANSIGEDPAVNLSERHVQRRLKAITDDFRARHQSLVDVEQYRQLQQHRAVAQEAWDAWRDSRRQGKHVTAMTKGNRFLPSPELAAGDRFGQ
jgi:hypothetical protein